jgi:hypothetical protein
LFCPESGLGGSPLLRAGEEPAADDQCHAEGEEPYVIRPPVIHALSDVMDGEKVMVDDAFYDIEQAPPDEHPADKGAPADGPSPVFGSFPEQP